MSYVTRFTVTAVTVILTTVLASAESAAQGKGGSSQPEAAPPVVVVVQASTLPAPGGRAVLVRRQAGSPREIIVLPAAGATAADLAAAMSLLAQARDRDKGRLPAPQVRTSISRADFATGQPPETIRYFENILARLARSATLEIPGVATGPALILPQNRTAAN